MFKMCAITALSNLIAPKYYAIILCRNSVTFVGRFSGQNIVSLIVPQMHESGGEVKEGCSKYIYFLIVLSSKSSQSKVIFYILFIFVSFLIFFHDFSYPARHLRGKMQIPLVVRRSFVFLEVLGLGRLKEQLK